jgi:preprotein translocase subunit SecY
MAGSPFQIADIPELRRRLLYTLGMLAVYRLGSFIPTPGINAVVLRDFFERAQGTLFGIFNLFSGGALERFSIFALGVMPYITSSIIMQILTMAIPALERLQKEGELGRRRITSYTRYLTIGLSFFQSFMLAITLEKAQGLGGELVVAHPGWSFRLLTAITLTGGTASLMWIGEQMTERGIGNGISMIIYAGIVVRIPSALANTIEFLRTGELSLFLLIFALALMAGVIILIVFMESSFRRIPVQYARRVVGRRVYGGQSTHLPLKVNTAGVIPPIFASSLLAFPFTILSFYEANWAKTLSQFITPGRLFYEVLNFVLIIFFAYFYTAILYNPVDLADNLKRWGGFIPGIRPGSATSEFIDRVLARITLVGALYVGAICVLPSFFIGSLHLPFYFGGTALLIAVGVAMDTMQQIETHLISRRYQGLLSQGAGSRTRIRGRRG